VLWLEGHALSFGQPLSYWPFLTLLKSYFGITDEDTAGACWAKLERQVTALFPEQVGEVLPYLATLLGVTVQGELAKRVQYIDGEAIRRQIFRALRRLFERLAQEHPVILVFEDWHWADQTSVEILEHLLPLVAIVPLLLCVISRPEDQTPTPRLDTLTVQKYAAGRATHITLAPLPPAASAHLLRNLLGNAMLPPQIWKFLLEKAGGNPFFL